MNKREIGQLLTMAALVDGRTVTPEACLMWHEVIGDIDYDMALEAVKDHFSRTTAWLLPAHVRDGVKAARARREVEDARQRALNPAPAKVGAPMPADYWDIVEANKRHD